MDNLQYFTPGPSEPYFTMGEHMRSALKEKVAAISHRSKDYEAIHRLAVDNMRKLLSVPASHHILFTASATEVWERVLQNCVANHSFHLVNGSFSQRFHEFAKMLGLQTSTIKKPLGESFDAADIQIEGSVEAICATHNETSGGTSFSPENIHALADKYPGKLMIVDAVSSVPYPRFDWAKVDCMFFSVQKGMGLPAGLGVWIVGERCISAHKEKQAKGMFTGTYHQLEAMLEKAAKNQTVETPNVLGIYLLGKVAGDMNLKGIDMIRRETDYKAALLYQAFADLPFLSPFVKEKQHRSKTVAVAELVGVSASVLVAKLKEQGFVLGKGYGSFKEKHIRIANFPTHSKESTEQLVDLLQGFSHDSTIVA